MLLGTCKNITNQIILMQHYIWISKGQLLIILILNGQANRSNMYNTYETGQNEYLYLNQLNRLLQIEWSFWSTTTTLNFQP